MGGNTLSLLVSSSTMNGWLQARATRLLPLILPTSLRSLLSMLPSRRMSTKLWQLPELLSRRRKSSPISPSFCPPLTLYERWRDMGTTDRADLMFKLSSLVEQNAELLGTVETWDNGKPYSVAVNEDVAEVAGTLKYCECETQSSPSEFIANSSSRRWLGGQDSWPGHRYYFCQAGIYHSRTNWCLWADHTLELSSGEYTRESLPSIQLISVTGHGRLEAWPCSRCWKHSRS